MPVGFLSVTERERLARFPSSVDPDDLGCFVLTPQVDHIARRHGRGARVAGGLQIGAMRLVGFVPDDLTDAPSAVVGFVADQVDGTPADLTAYSTRPHTTSDHVSAVVAHLGFRRGDSSDLKVLGTWLSSPTSRHGAHFLPERPAATGDSASGKDTTPDERRSRQGELWPKMFEVRFGRVE